MASAMSRDSNRVIPVETEYERVRRENIEANKHELESLGLLALAVAVNLAAAPIHYPSYIRLFHCSERDKEDKGDKGDKEVVDRRGGDKPALATKPSKKTRPMSELKLGDVVYLCGYEEEDSKEAFIGKGVIQNVAGGMLHGKVIGTHYLSLTVSESYEDDHPLLEPLTGDDPTVTTVGQAKDHYILWTRDCVSLCALV